jgi:hypothetical protein
VCNDFLSKFGGQVGRSSLISDDAITAYIMDLPVFTTKYKEVISRLYLMVNNAPIPENLLSLYLDKFKSQGSGYTIDDLNNDILEGRAPTIVGSHGDGVNVLQNIKDTWAKIHGGVPSSHTLNTLLAQVGDAEFVMSCLIRQFDIFRNKRVVDVQSAFLAEYGREPLVPEFMKIMEKGGDGDGDSSFDIAAMHAMHRRHLVAVKELYAQYVADEISEVDFVKRYIYAIDDDPQYKDDIVSALTASPAYEREMCAVVRKAFKALYDMPLAPEDERHMFEQIKGKRLSLVSQEISEIVAALKAETDMYLESLDAIYSGILTRSPDAYECVHYKKLYRDDHDVNKSAERVRADLFASLEYHDVLKTKIRTMCEEEHIGPLLPSKLFALLNVALKDDRLMKNDEALRSMVVSTKI